MGDATGPDSESSGKIHRSSRRDNIAEPGAAANANANAARVVRDAVAARYPDRILDPSTAKYQEAQTSYWNELQREHRPVCFFQPTCADQVRAAIVEVARAQARFAIKSGGHSSNADASSLPDGFQFDLVNLTHLEVAEDRKSVRLGPGLRWGPVLEELEKVGLTAVGGRDWGVGVAGFIYGGGISYFSNQYGWGIDNLISSDVVLANGDLLTVDADSHPDLHRALHGGGAHNFGIVVSLTVKTYPLDGMWGGLTVYEAEHFDDIFTLYDDYTCDLNNDHHAHMILDFFRRDGKMILAQFTGYTAPIQHPAIFQRFRSVPSKRNTERLSSYSALTHEMAVQTDSRGKRNAYWTLAMKYDIELIKAGYQVFAQRTEPFAARLHFAYDVNHITSTMRNKAAREGAGNVYGLEGADEPLTNILLTGVWEHEADSALVLETLKDMGNAIETLAREKGKGLSFKYMNYGNQEQDVVTGFGQKNQAFLKAVSARYDPQGVFQRQQYGGFKLDPSK